MPPTFDSTIGGGGGGGDAVGNGCKSRRHRSDDSDDGEDEDDLHHRHRRKRPQSPTKSLVTMTSTVSSESQPLALSSSQQQPRLQEQPKLQSQLPQSHQQCQSQIQNQPQPPSSLMSNTSTGKPFITDAEKNKKLLEWELSTLEANDLRSHAWYHGERIGRVVVEQLLRKYVAEEHGIKITKTIKTNTTTNINRVTKSSDNVTNAAAASITQNENVFVASRERKGDSNCDSDSDDGLEDVSSMSSDGDFGMDDYLDEFIDDNGRVPDPSMATSTLMASALLINQRRRMNGVLPMKRPKRQPRKSKHFYCFLVRASTNVKPPGRYVVSCLRVDKYDDIEDQRKNGEDEHTQMKRLRRQLKRRQLRQQRHPVLHFVINEIILQPGTVYERSQFTFGDSLPSISTPTIHNHNKQPIQPGFDSVPDLIRYYVGSAGDDAVLSYGGGNEGVFGSSMIFPQSVPTEVRIRYPCNRRYPLTNEVPSLESTLQAKERTRQVQQHSHALAMAAALAKTLPVPNACTIVPVEPKFPPHQPPSWSHGQSTFRPLHRRTPSATVTSATITSVLSSAAESVPPDKQLSSFLSSPAKIVSNQSDSESTMNQSSKTLPRALLIPESFSSSMHRSSSTLPRPSTVPSPSIPSTSGSSSNPDLLNTALFPCSSSSPVTKLKKTPNDSISVSTSPSSSFSSISRFTPLKNMSNNKPYSQVELALGGPSTSAGFSTPGTSGSSELHKSLTTSNSRGTGIIDMDAEIAAALDAENRISDDEFDFYHIPESTVVRSSFARVDITNSHQNRSENQNHILKSSRSRLENLSKSSMPGIEENEHVQVLELTEPRNDQYQKLPLECSSKHQSHDRYQVDNDHTHRLGKYDFGRGSNSKYKVSGVKTVQQCSLELRTQRSKILQKNVAEWTIQDLANSEIERLVRTGKMNPDKDSDSDEQPPTGNENFEEWRARWITSVTNETSDTLEQQHKEHLNQRRTIMEQHIRLPQQDGEIQTNSAQVENFRENMRVNSNISPIVETASSVECVASSSIQHKTTSSETLTTSSSIRTSNDVIVETMISRWVGINSQDLNHEHNSHGINYVPEPNRNFHLDILQRRRRRRIDRRSVQKDHPSPTGDNTPPVRDYSLPAEKCINLPQPNQKMTHHQVSDLHAHASDNININQSSSNVVFGDNSKNLTTATSKSKNDNYSTCSDSINRDYENVSNSPNCKKLKKNFNKNLNNFANHYNDISQECPNQNNGNSHGNTKNNNEVVNSAMTSIEYENIVTQNPNNSKLIKNYKHFGTEKKELRNQMIRQTLIHEDNGSNATVAAALLAVHRAIIGDPKDLNEQVSVAGTGKLAAALCRADGRATVLPYRRHQSENESDGMSIGPNFDTCPLQILGHPGAEGRRARLDVIERFACLQYLVEMTVIVTPCLLLIGGKNKDLVNSADIQIEWSLEDEYEYRRILFYYQCAGIGDWDFLDNNSSSDDEDNTFSSNDCDSQSSIPSKEEWAAEKRHWLDLLTRHRAAALDKWIRTAADTKQALGDVYGYRALMTALCSDRIQTLQDAWAMLRRLHTNTAVTFESRLRPEFLGRQEHPMMGMVTEAHDLNSNNMDALLQLPPNATVPDPTTLAVLYEHLYDEDNESDIRKPSTMFTSLLLLSPSIWSTSNNGIGTLGGGLGKSVNADFGLCALHDLCVQYSKWVQNYNNNDNNTLSSKSPLQLERFRRNFQTLLRQSNDENNHDDDEDDYDNGFNQKNLNEKHISHHEKSDNKRDDEFVYERNYEDKMKEYDTSGGDYDNCGDDDDEDDDATVICCNARTDSAASKITKGKQHRNWIKAAVAHGQGPAPLDIVFRTELHVQLFWPPTLLINNINGKNSQNFNENHQLTVPAYALGTTYAATAAATHYHTNKGKQDGHRTALSLNQIINEQLNCAAQDMHFRYKIMDDLLNKACSNSSVASKSANNAVKDNQKQFLY